MVPCCNTEWSTVYSSYPICVKCFHTVLFFTPFFFFFHSVPVGGRLSRRHPALPGMSEGCQHLQTLQLHQVQDGEAVWMRASMNVSSSSSSCAGLFKGKHIGYPKGNFLCSYAAVINLWERVGAAVFLLCIDQGGKWLPGSFPFLPASAYRTRQQYFAWEWTSLPAAPDTCRRSTRTHLQRTAARVSLFTEKSAGVAKQRAPCRQSSAWNRTFRPF